LAWYIVGKSGSLLERSIIDRTVCAAERLVFESSPDLDPPLAQEKREATIHDGAPLDTKAACADLNGVEQVAQGRGGAELGNEVDAAKKTSLKRRSKRRLHTAWIAARHSAWPSDGAKESCGPA
jgi:hypothetical protein